MWFRLFLLISLVFVLQTSIFAQINDQDENKSSSSGSITSFEFDVSNPLEQPFYIDSYGLELMQQNFHLDSFSNIDTYKLAPNDLLSIELTGKISTIMRGISINAEGDIMLPTIGKVTLTNLNISEAERAIQSAVNKKLQDTKATLSLDRMSRANIHVNGQIPFPGNYKVPAQTRVDKAIMPALTDGVNLNLNSKNQKSGSSNTQMSMEFLNNNNFSLRNIVLQRSDGSRDTADIIAYYRAGDLKANPYVNNGDVIQLHRTNEYSPEVSISGAVRSSQEFEYNEQDTPQKIIDMAGGLRYDAQQDYLNVYRQNNSDSEAIKVPIEEYNTFRLKPFDRIVVPLNRERRNTAAATVHGEVESPGRFPIKDGETSLFELLSRAGGLSNTALADASYLIRNENSEQIVTENINEDRIKRASNQVTEGFEYLEMETRLSEGRVFVNLSNKQLMKEVKLFDGDQLFIPRDDNTVFVFGQVKNPGYYPFNHTDLATPRSYIQKAGGMTIAADLERIHVIKAGNKNWVPIEKATLESGDMVFVDRIPFESIVEKRNFELQMSQQRNSNISLIMSGVTTITGIITTIVAIRN